MCRASRLCTYERTPCHDQGMTDWRDYLGLDDTALFAQCEFDRFRASGPGGQKRNKTESAVRLRHTPTSLTGEANESRSQHENRARALRRLRLTIAVTLCAPVDIEAYAPPPALAAALLKPPGARASGRIEVMAALFDLLDASGWRLADAARTAGVSTAAIGRLLASDNEVWRAASERRAGLGLTAMRRG